MNNDPLILDLTQEEEEIIDEDKDTPVKKMIVTELSDDDDLLFGSPIFKRGSNQTTTIATLSSSSTCTSTANSTQNRKHVPKEAPPTEFNTSNLKHTCTTFTTTTTKKPPNRKTKKTPQYKLNDITLSTNSDVSSPNANKKRSRPKLTDDEKAVRAADREMARTLKTKRQAEEKRAKADRLQKERQANGKFAKDEICVVMERQFEQTELAKILCSDFKEVGYEYVCQNDYPIDGCIRWVRKDSIKGGSKSAASFIASGNEEEEDGVEWMEIVAIVFHSPGIFLDMLKRSEEDDMRDDYPLIREWLAKVRSTLRTNLSGREQQRQMRRCSTSTKSKDSRVVLILHNIQSELSRRWTNGGRRRNSFSPTTTHDLHDAVIWLLMELQCECEITSSKEETIEYLRSLTKTLAEVPYFENATELHCIKKIRASDSASNDNHDEKSKDVWLRMLQQVPLLSTAKAMGIVQRYPTMRSLVEEYNDNEGLSEDQKRTLVARCMSTDGAGKNYVKLSDSLYRCMTSENADEII